MLTYACNVCVFGFSILAHTFDAAKSSTFSVHKCFYCSATEIQTLIVIKAAKTSKVCALDIYDFQPYFRMNIETRNALDS